MSHQSSNVNRQAIEMVAGVISIAAFILQDEPSPMHPLIGFILLLYLLRDFKSPDCAYDRFLYSAVLAFVSVLLTSIFVEKVVEAIGKAQIYDFVLAVQVVLICIVVFFIKKRLEHIKGGTVT